MELFVASGVWRKTGPEQKKFERISKNIQPLQNDLQFNFCADDSYFGLTEIPEQLTGVRDQRCIFLELFVASGVWRKTGSEHKKF